MCRQRMIFLHLGLNEFFLVSSFDSMYVSQIIADWLSVGGTHGYLCGCNLKRGTKLTILLETKAHILRLFPASVQYTFFNPEDGLCLTFGFAKSWLFFSSIYWCKGYKYMYQVSHFLFFRGKGKEMSFFTLSNTIEMDFFFF